MTKEVFRRVIKSLLIGFIIGAAIASLFFFAKFYLQGKLPMGAKIAGVDVGLKTPEEAIQIINDKEKEYLVSPFVFTLASKPDSTGTTSAPASTKKVEILPSEIGLDILAEDTVATVGRMDFKQQNPFEIIQDAKKLQGAEILYSFDKDKLIAKLTEKFELSKIAPLNARYVVGAGNKLVITEEKAGQSLEVESVIKTVGEMAAAMKNTEISLTLGKKNPEITKAELEKFRAEFESKLKTTIKISYGKNKWTFKPMSNLDFIKFEEYSTITIPYLGKVGFFENGGNNASPSSNDETTQPAATGDQPITGTDQAATQSAITAAATGATNTSTTAPLTMTGFAGTVTKEIKITVDETKLNEFIDKEMSAKIESEAESVSISKNAEGAIVIEGKGSDGTKIQRGSLKKSIELAINEKITDVELQTRTIKATTNISSELQEMGIKELIGVGHSSFYGSHVNRIHNINVGIAKMNGTIIPMGGTFSFNDTLGSVDDTTGYKKELVITKKGTIPEYGGGLCQVSTTMYRAAIFTGLPITERAPHSYVVSYYAQVLGNGLDATIYVGGQDLKFTNDTQAPILIQGYVDGMHAYFKFYGTSDGRSVKMDGPFISNYRSAPKEVLYIVDPSIAPGQKQLIENRNTGLDALWYRTITRKDGTEQKEEIISRYRAGQEKYLVAPGSVY